MSRKSIAVVGGGLAGLVAAMRLSCDFEVDLFEAGPRLGGYIRTTTCGGHRVEAGPDAFLCRVPEGVSLCHELGLELIHPARRNAWLWVEDALVPIPTGSVLGVPRDVDDPAWISVVGEAGVAAMRREMQTEHLSPQSDITVGALIRSHFGDEVADRAVGPLIGGINAGDIDELVASLVAPQLLQLAVGSGSMVRAAARVPEGDGPVFAAPSRGMESLIAALVARCTERGVRTHLDHSIGVVPDADGVVLATPLGPMKSMLRHRMPGLAGRLDSIPTASCAIAVVSYDPTTIDCPMDGSGVLIAPDPDLRITAISWAHAKWGWNATSAPVTLRVSIGSRRDPTALELDDDEILRTVQRDLARVMGIDAEPVDWFIGRFPDAFPQYVPGHEQMIDEVESELLKEPAPIVLAGMPLRGVGIPAVIRSAERAAHTLATSLGSQ